MSDSSETKWPEFAGSYLDAFGHIDADIFQTAGSLWPYAARFGRSLGFDETTAQTALIKACANVSAARLRGTEVGSLGAYLIISYKRELWGKLPIRDRYVVLDPEHENSTESSGLALDQKILIEELLSKMRTEPRSIYEMLILGHTYEDIAKRLGRQSNVLRSLIFKELERIRKAIEAEEGQ
jgi:DNA-directed RNA polymerase specialized sigma24 family protein